MVGKILLPAIFFWNQNHYVIVYKIKKNKVHVSDPAFGLTTYSKKEFIKGWMANGDKGIALLLEPQETFHELKLDKVKRSSNIKYITRHLKNFRTQLYLIGLTLVISSTIELIFPFFTQKIIDKGVITKDISIIYWILFAQLIYLFPELA